MTRSSANRTKQLRNDRSGHQANRFLGGYAFAFAICGLFGYAGDAQAQRVEVPYYSNNFEEVYRMVDAGCRGLLALIRQEQGI